ncbi:MAG: diacylglycerol kinase, partial [Dehalococcoidia bacterium]
VSPQWQEDARRAKDAAAGMVLVISTGAAICGILVFGPHVW